MDFMQSIWNSFSHFSFTDLFTTLSNPVNIGIIVSLVIMEGLLSCDNALVLAVMVKHLPPKLRKKALFYGIMGAYLFRFIAVGLGTILIKFWWVKLVGASYLLWIAGKYFWDKAKEADEVSILIEPTYGFWRTILAVEMMDIAFSLDSILAAFGISNKVWVLWLGAILGILMMRGVAQFFVLFIEKFPEIESAAYLLIGFIGVKMALTIINIHMPDYAFIVVMIVILGGTLLYHNRKNKGKTRS